MKLKAKTQIRNRMVNMLIETSEFTEAENDMLDQVGEPVICIDKMFGPFPVKIEKKVRSGFKIIIKLDGNLVDDMEEVNTEIENILLEIEGAIKEKMAEASTDYSKALDARKDTDYDKEITTEIPVF